VRGFATKFYTPEGNFDLVGNNIPVFFIQDGIKFPDVVHAVKPEPHHEMPQAASAHDTFWDFASLVPESAHMVMWVMSDRSLPRSYRMMEGFGVHTFRLINEKGKSSLVKFHWKPVLGTHALVWDEAQKIAGKDPDFHRRDLWEAIETGNFPEYELGLQIIDEEDAQKYGFDLLDPTKVLPEEQVPVQRVGKMVLNRNPDNFFAETEQVAYCVSNVVPGIDFTNDPLMQARLFSYLDTQLTRLGGPNFAEIPINRPVVEVHNHQQDGFHRDTINVGRVNYHPNSLGGGCPFLASQGQGFTSVAERMDGEKGRYRSESFNDHFSQATLFFKSLTRPEQEHLIAALQFELGKVERPEIRQRMVSQVLVNIDMEMATRVARAVGVEVPKAPKPAKVEKKGKTIESAPSLSMEHSPKDSIRTRKVAVLVADGFSSKEVEAVKKALMAGGAIVDLVAPRLGTLKSREGDKEEPVKTFLTAHSVLYDAVYVPGGEKSIATLSLLADAVDFVRDAYRHCKAVGFSGEATQLVEVAGLSKIATMQPLAEDPGVVMSPKSDMKKFNKNFIAAIAAHRNWAREAPPPA
jgi:catalase